MPRSIAFSYYENKYSPYEKYRVAEPIHRHASGMMPAVFDHPTMTRPATPTPSLPAAYACLALSLGVARFWRDEAPGPASGEATAEAENAWQLTMNEASVDAKAFFLDCTPSYLSSEGDKDNPHGMLASNFGGKPTDFFDMLSAWRSTGRLEGVTIR